MHKYLNPLNFQFYIQLFFFCQDKYYTTSSDANRVFLVHASDQDKQKKNTFFPQKVWFTLIYPTKNYPKINGRYDVQPRFIFIFKPNWMQESRTNNNYILGEYYPKLTVSCWRGYYLLPFAQKWLCSNSKLKATSHFPFLSFRVALSLVFEYFRFSTRAEIKY